MSLARSSNAIAASFVVAMAISSKAAQAEGEVDRVDDGFSVAGEYLKKSGFRDAGRTLVRTGTGLGYGLAVNDARNKDWAGAVGGVVSTTVGIAAIPKGAAIGTVVLGPGFGTVVGATAGVGVTILADYQTEKLTQRAIDGFRDKRYPLQRQMEKVGLDRRRFARERNADFSTPSGVAQFEAAQARRSGQSYIPNPQFQNIIDLWQSLADLEQSAEPAKQAPDGKQTSGEKGRDQECGPMTAQEQQQIEDDLGFNIAQEKIWLENGRRNLERSGSAITNRPRAEARQIREEREFSEKIQKHLKQVREKNGGCAPTAETAQDTARPAMKESAEGRASNPQTDQNLFTERRQHTRPLSRRKRAAGGADSFVPTRRSWVNKPAKIWIDNGKRPKFDIYKRR